MKQIVNDRATLLKNGLSMIDQLIEVGPSYNPILRKADGWRTTVVDHATKAELLAKYYHEPSVDTSMIEEVDIIWRDGALADAFAPSDYGMFSAILASHVLEHVPDPVEFFRSAQKILREKQSSLRLALPDKRYCFDFFRPLATTGRLLEAHLNQATHHRFADHFDHVAYMAFADGRPGWGAQPFDKLELCYEMEFGKQNAERTLKPDSGYIDCHAWQFTPSSFELLVIELGELDMIDWKVDWLLPQPQLEFLVCLSRPRYKFTSRAALQKRRLELLKQICFEQAQAAQLIRDLL